MTTPKDSALPVITEAQIHQFLMRWERLDAERTDVVQRQRKQVTEADARGAHVMRILLRQGFGCSHGSDGKKAFEDLYHSAIAGL